VTGYRLFETASLFHRDAIAAPAIEMIRPRIEKGAIGLCRFVDFTGVAQLYRTEKP